MSPFTAELESLANFSGGPPHIIGSGYGNGNGNGYGNGDGSGDGYCDGYGDGDGASKALHI